MDPNFQHLMLELFKGPYVEELDLNLRKKKNYEPKGLLTVSLLDMFPKVVAVLEDELTLLYSRNSKGYGISTNSSTELRVSYLFLKLCYECTGRKFYTLTRFILAKFFELYLRKDFGKRGGWKHLETHILRKKYNEYYDLLKVSGPALLEELRANIRDTFLSELLRSRVSSKEIHIIKLQADKLSNDLLRSLEANLMNELNTVRLLNKEQSVTSQTEGPSSSKTKGYNSEHERHFKRKKN
ncbi:hypothetical protein NPIL_151441 [Nephila pilipes]|uniref:Uncharacterized protein n=1 Tax=Nephila pilipes TaxID=299642 RepID=A0A8X6QFQ6_NEPPI|nr:hypothetical protein NPIL_151441 [Nephila pilipes]